jgi:hypothetical protein
MALMIAAMPNQLQQLQKITEILFGNTGNMINFE